LILGLSAQTLRLYAFGGTILAKCHYQPVR
jgi:hypothetical protein